MKSRLFFNEIWDNPKFQAFPPEVKLVYAYLITNSQVGHLGIYQISEKRIALDTGLELEDIHRARKLLSETIGKVHFFEDWIYLVGSQEECGYFGPKSQKALVKEIKAVDKKALEYFRSFGHEIPYRYPMPSHIKHKTENISHESETKNHEEETISHEQEVLSKETESNEKVEVTNEIKSFSSSLGKSYGEGPFSGPGWRNGKWDPDRAREDRYSSSR